MGENRRNKTTLNMCIWNANSILGKIGQLRVFVKKHQFDIIGITESKLLKKTPPNISGYEFIYKNRDAVHPAGGLILYIRETIKYEEITTNTDRIETIGIKIGTQTIVLVYVRTNVANFDEDLDNLLRREQKIILIGDFNARHEAWHNPNNNTRGRALLNYVERNNYEIVAPVEATRISNVPQYTDSVIDIAVHKNSNLDLETINDLNSDHLPVKATIRTTNVTLMPPRTYRDYKNVNWMDFQTKLKNRIRINRDLDTTRKIDEAIAVITNNIQIATEECVPKAQSRNNGLPQNIQDKIDERNRQRYRYKRYRNREDLLLLQEMNQEIMVLIRSLDEYRWHQQINRIQGNKENVWKKIKSAKRGKNINIIPPFKIDQRTVTSNHEKAQILAETLATINIQTINMSNPRTTQIVNADYEHLIQQNIQTPIEALTNPFEVSRIIKAMRPYKAPGEDEIIPKILKKLNKKTITQLYYIYNACLKLHYFPNPWKNAIIIPLKKPFKDPSNPTNYRPISLTNTMSKVLEHLIHRRLRDHLEEQNIIIQEQFGFVKRKSTTLQLARIVDEAMKNSNIKYSTAMVLLDIEKAYDTIWRKGLLHKMAVQNIPPHIIKIINSYLTNRTIQTKIKDQLSDRIITEEGLPQGSVIAPTLFNIFINDIPKNNNTKLAMFADDTAIFAKSVREEQAKIYIQRHLRQLETYFNKWKLKINVEKTQLTVFNHKHNRNHNFQHTVSMYDTIIEETDTIKYLGVHLDRKLLFKKHIEQTRRKARVAKSYIYPYIQKTNPLSRKLKIQLYKAYIRSIMLYAAPVWSQAANYLIEKIETMERNTLRTILGTSSMEINNERLYQIVGITPIKEVILGITRNFFAYKTTQHDFTRNIGTVNRDNANFRKIHRLITDAIV